MSYTYTPQKPEDTIDLKELFFSLIAQWKVIIICIIIALICATLYLRVTPKVYSVDAMVQVEDKSGASSALLGKELSGIMGAGGLGGSQLADGEVEILKSRLVLGSTIQQLNLDIAVEPKNNSLITKVFSPLKFNTQYSPQGVSVYQDKASFVIKKLNVPQAFLDQPLLLSFTANTYTFTDKKTEQVLFKGQLNTLEQKKTDSDNVWTVEIDSKDTLPDQYIVTKNAITTATNNFIGNYSAQERGKQTNIIGLTYQGTDKQLITEALNRVLSNYKQQNIESSSAQKAQTLSFLNKQLPVLKEDLDTAEKVFNRFREKNNTVDVNQEAQLYLKQSVDLETQKIVLKEKQAELQAKYTSEHPMVLQINAQITAIDQKIAELNSSLKKLPETQRQYLQLYREVEVKNELYTSLLNTYQTMSVAKAGEIGNVRIIDTAIQPIKAIKPRGLIILALSIIVGLFFGVMIALTRNLLRTGIKDTAEIETQFDLPVYATVPRSPQQLLKDKLLKKKSSIPLLAIKDSDDVAIESLRSLRTAIHFALAKTENKVIMISGASPAVGKSFISANLAAILAQSGSRILLIDGDMRRGYLHKYFSNENENGLAEVLLEKSSINEVIKPTDLETLHFLGRGKNPSHPSELLNTGLFEKMLDQLKTEYDHIIIDTPPVLAVTDATIVSQFSDVNLLVVRFAKTSKKELELTINRFTNSNSPIHGVVLNDIQSTGSYGYGYNYAYDYKAKK
ncbi:polysaccharide biosynthesis tyrosine autokinase [Acinetobacter rathckeae]|uniref:polysaccharide biosynthesis tyrosine autokinase n=1 Tax=Acinetobacter rathckeae TaxID=2605272 RepID=UPI0018A25FAF|nr:polysaccharide biosynthesis tyrosine autokinase [Acinetobacter rathckeae]MBF7688999.1 polysaccharide biosynthesis tyrosine autokinase [Acinetobacter rathckeae]MBF7696519.1 polysaccharide biosynthesis tyrosine autokinase [Acinetobacter rathckeae]